MSRVENQPARLLVVRWLRDRENCTCRRAGSGVPATHLKKTTICVPTLLTVLFICATGIMITIAPRSQAATPQSPTVPQLKTEPAPCCACRSRERFRQVSGLSAPRPLNERFVRRGRLLVAARERALAFSSAPSARRRLSRAISRSVSFK